MKRDLLKLWIAVCLFTSANIGFSQLNPKSFGPDVVVYPQTQYTRYFKDVKVATAYDGAIYVARIGSKISKNGPYKGVEILKSTDKGVSFSYYYTFYYNITAPFEYTNIDMCVVGKNANDFRLYVCCPVIDTTNNKYYLDVFYLDKDANLTDVTSIKGNSYYNRVIDPGSTIGYSSISWATDSRKPSPLSSPYSLVLAAVKKGMANDSLITWSAVDTISSFNRRAFVGTRNIGKVSVAMGNRVVGSTSVVGIAYESQSSDGSQSNIQCNWYDIQSSGYLSDVNSLTYGLWTDKIYNPSIAISQTRGETSTGPGYDFIRTMLTYERGNTGNKDVYFTLVDDVTSSSIFTAEVAIANSSDNEVNPYAAFEPSHMNFITVYYNATTGALPYLWKSLANISNGTGLNVATANYRDAMTLPTQLIEPRVSYNNGTANFAWDDENLTMFDSEKSVVSVDDNAENIHLKVYPNPANNMVAVSGVDLTKYFTNYRVLDITGKVILTSKINNISTIDVSNLNSGIYFLHLEGQFSKTIKLEIKH